MCSLCWHQSTTWNYPSQVFTSVHFFIKTGRPRFTIISSPLFQNNSVKKQHCENNLGSRFTKLIFSRSRFASNKWNNKMIKHTLLQDSLCFRYYKVKIHSVEKSSSWIFTNPEIYTRQDLTLRWCQIFDDPWLKRMNSRCWLTAAVVHVYGRPGYLNNLELYNFSPTEGYRDNHSFLFSSQHPQGVSSAVFHPGHSLLLIGGCLQQQPMGEGDEVVTMATQQGITVWRVLSTEPHYKLVTDYAAELGHVSILFKWGCAHFDIGFSPSTDYP